MRTPALILATLVALPVPAPVAAQAASERRIDSLLAQMTLEEKLGQLNLITADGRATPAQVEQVRRGLVGGFLNVDGAEATRDIQRVAPGIRTSRRPRRAPRAAKRGRRA